MDIETKIQERNKLAEALAECESGAFPGSKAFYAESRALKALADYDAANPEVYAEVMARHRAELAAERIPAGGR